MDMAEISHYSDEADAADRYLAEADRQFAEMIAADPSNSEWREARLRFLELTVRMRIDRNANDAALEEIVGDAQAEVAAAARDIGSTVDLLAVRARLAQSYAAVLSAAGRRAEAEPVVRSIVDEVNALGEPPFMLQASLLPLAEFLGDEATAARLAQAIRDAGFAHPWLKMP
jgi:hypothetical protein